jgi:hypothetical protein
MRKMSVLVSIQQSSIPNQRVPIGESRSTSPNRRAQIGEYRALAALAAPKRGRLGVARPEYRRLPQSCRGAAAFLGDPRGASAGGEAWFSRKIAI